MKRLQAHAREASSKRDTRNAKCRRPLSGDRGQAMVEYAIILSFLFIFAFVIPIPSSVGRTSLTLSGKTEQGQTLNDRTMMGALIEAYRVYTVSHYYVLNLPFP